MVKADKVNQQIYNIHGNVNNSMAPFVSALIASLGEALENVPTMMGDDRMAKIARTHSDFGL